MNSKTPGCPQLSLVVSPCGRNLGLVGGLTAPTPPHPLPLTTASYKDLSTTALHFPVLVVFMQSFNVTLTNATLT